MNQEKKYDNSEDSWTVLSGLESVWSVTTAASESSRSRILGTSVAAQQTPPRSPREAPLPPSVSGDRMAPEQEHYFEVKPMADVRRAKYCASNRNLRGHTGRSHFFRELHTGRVLCAGKYAADYQGRGLYEVESIKHASSCLSQALENETQIKKYFTSEEERDRTLSLLSEASVLAPRTSKRNYFQNVTTYLTREMLFASPPDIHPCHARPARSATRAEAESSGLFEYRMYESAGLAQEHAPLRDFLAQDSYPRTVQRSARLSRQYAAVKRNTRKKKRNATRKEAAISFLGWQHQIGALDEQDGNGQPTQRTRSSTLRAHKSSKEDDSTSSTNCADDTEDGLQRATAASTDEEPYEEEIGKCSICMEVKPLLLVMKRCRYHPSACPDCLWTWYIDEVQSQSRPAHTVYPLRCFWPGCGRTLRGTQIEKFAKTKSEIDRHYLKEAEDKRWRVAKAEEEKERIAVIQNKRHQRARREGAKRSLLKWLLSLLPEDEVVSVMAAVGASGEGAAVCPSCGTLFVKEGGCNSVTCGVCDCVFPFSSADGRVLSVP